MQDKRVTKCLDMSSLVRCLCALGSWVRFTNHHSRRNSIGSLALGFWGSDSKRCSSVTLFLLVFGRFSAYADRPEFEDKTSHCFAA